MNHTFESLLLPEALLRALKTVGFDTPTPIQQQAIPLAIQGRDLIATAQTGTGKTGAFCIPLITQLLCNPRSQTLILAPTRELALQIEQVWKTLTQFLPEMRTACIIGGTSFSVQRKMISRSPRVIIATPGRLVDHLQQRTIQLSQIHFLVLDEADRMLDMGFAPQLNTILNALPKQRQTLLFSATWDQSLDQLSKKYLKNPERIAVGSTSRAAPTIEQEAIKTTAQNKNETLLDQLNLAKGSVLVFARTQHRTDRLARFLQSYGVKVGRLHGGRTQGQRNSTLSAFRTGEIRVLVATDIAARGIDVEEITHVINYDLPRAAEDYIHRIGRTGRAGAQGRAVSLLVPEELGQWKSITQLLKKTGSQAPRLIA